MLHQEKEKGVWRRYVASLSRMHEYVGECPFDNVWFLIALTHHIHHHFFLRLTQLNEVCFFYTCIASDSSPVFEKSFQHAQSPSLGVKEQNISHVSRVNVIKNIFLSGTHWPKKLRGPGIRLVDIYNVASSLAKAPGRTKWWFNTLLHFTSNSSRQIEREVGRQIREINMIERTGIFIRIFSTVFICWL